jgi:hypothetical protein
MQLAAPALLEIWERASALGGIERTVSMLCAALGSSPGEVARLPIGERDRHLLELRAAAFGSRMPCFARCPRCTAELEFELSTSALLERTAGLGAPAQSQGPATLAFGDCVVTFRLPSSDDLRAVSGSHDAAEAARHLLERCVLDARAGERSLAPAEFSHDLASAVSSAMAERDPGADLHLELACAECGDQFRSLFDIGAFLWVEIEREARRLLRQVHVLAASYGWTEEQILGLSPARRKAYLELVAT